MRDSQYGFKHKRSCFPNLFYNDLLHAHDNTKSLDIVYLDFQKAFDKVPHSKLMLKIKQLKINGKAHNWTKNWLSNSKQIVIIYGTASDWTPVTGGIPKDSVLGPALFIIYINGVNVELNNFISKSVDDTKTGNSILNDHDRLNLREDLRKISERFERWKIPFNVNKCHILHMGTSSQDCDYEMNGVKLDSVQYIKDLGVSITSNLNFSRQCKDTAGKANRMMSFIYRNFSFKNNNITLPLYISLVRPPPGICRAILVAPPYKRHSTN